MYVHIYIYIYRERERERCVHLSLSIYIYTYNHTYIYICSMDARREIRRTVSSVYPSEASAPSNIHLLYTTYAHDPRCLCVYIYTYV